MRVDGHREPRVRGSLTAAPNLPALLSGSGSRSALPAPQPPGLAPPTRPSQVPVVGRRARGWRSPGGGQSRLSSSVG